jgi:hypothetical protein
LTTSDSFIRGGKGDKDRYVMLPLAAGHEQIEWRQASQPERAGHSWVNCPQHGRKNILEPIGRYAVTRFIIVRWPHRSDRDHIGRHPLADRLSSTPVRASVEGKIEANDDNRLPPFDQLTFKAHEDFMATTNETMNESAPKPTSSDSADNRREFLKRMGWGMGAGFGAMAASCGKEPRSGGRRRRKNCGPRFPTPAAKHLVRLASNRWLWGGCSMWKPVDGEFDPEKQRNKIDGIVDREWDFCCFQAVQIDSLANHSG